MDATNKNDDGDDDDDDDDVDENEILFALEILFPLFFMKWLSVNSVQSATRNLSIKDT